VYVGRWHVAFAVRTCVIINPVAGSAGDIGRLASALADLPGVRVLLTTRGGEAETLAREAAEQGFGRIVAGGGDGTVNDVLNGIAGHLDRVEMGILPVGTGNDFTASIGMRLPPEEAVPILLAWRSRPVDIVRVRGTGREGPCERLMLNGSAGGFVEVVGSSTDQQSKRGILGPLSYVLSAAFAADQMETYTLRIHVGESRVEIRGIATIVSNGRTVGGGMPVSPEARIDDGEIEVMVIPEMPLGELVLLGVSIANGTHLTDSRLYTARGPRVVIESEPPMPVNADGESLGNTPVTYEVLPRALRIVVAPGAPAQGP
jgi:diacylglycerol kinase (ATP)